MSLAYEVQGLGITELAEQYGTPLYLYDGAEITTRFQGLRGRLHPALEVFYVGVQEHGVIMTPIWRRFKGTVMSGRCAPDDSLN